MPAPAKAIVGSDETRKVVGMVCSKLGIMETETVNRIYDKVKDCISAAEYSELTPDEMLLTSKAVNESAEEP